MKRLLDLVVTCVLLLLASPILLAIAVAVRLDSPGPILFRQGRIGKDRKIYQIFKFRTMIVGAEQLGTGLFNYRDDPRITRIGRFLRRTSLDELPQMLNVIIGDMSLVGPRPPVSYELGDPTTFTGDLLRRFSVRPGITGLAQISGRNELSWEDKIRYDMKYLTDFQRFGILLDLKLLVLTAVKVMRMQNTYELPENLEKDASRMNSTPPER